MAPRPPSFGFLFDIDGVLLRGRTVLNEAKAAFQLLLNKEGQWRVPTVFVTNAGNSLRKSKAEKLSSLFNVKVHTDQMVMSHSPLSMFDHFHDKYVLICGQGPIKEIARNIGFKNVITVDDYKHQFPSLDACDHNRLKPAPCAFEHYNKRVEAVVLFGEPVKWETCLQLILDVLMSDGQPYRMKDDTINLLHGDAHRKSMPLYPHVPLLACNMDLMWMSEAPLPRLAHGGFLLALESLYEKFTGKRLLYTALVGKPSELTYHHAMGRLNYVASKYCLNQTIPVKRVYCIGDNPQTDIYGANLYNKYLQARRSSGVVRLARSMLASSGMGGKSRAMGGAAFKTEPVIGGVASDMKTSQGQKYGSNFSALSSIVKRIKEGNAADDYADKLESILVLTGVYQERISMDPGQVNSMLNTSLEVNHNHRDFPDYPELRIPTHLAKDVAGAVRYAFQKENFPDTDE